MDIRRRYPMEDFARLREEMFSPFMEPFPTFLHQAGPWTGNWQPSVDIRETEEEITVIADVPGFDKEDLDITINEDHIILKGEAKLDQQHDEAGYRMRERRWGSFQRRIPLPAKVLPQQTKADYQRGVVEITLTKDLSDQRRGHRITFH
ncbi:MAG: Hsp20/alpha crystallin family protein [Limnochordia bacterium]|jgi:HSP20 family protein